MAALNPDNTKACFSNYGYTINVDAPGVGIVSTYWDGRFAEMNLGAFESFDGDDEGCERVAVMGYFRGQYYVSICIVNAERSVSALLK